MPGHYFGVHDRLADGEHAYIAVMLRAVQSKRLSNSYTFEVNLNNGFVTRAGYGDVELINQAINMALIDFEMKEFF